MDSYPLYGIYGGSFDPLHNGHIEPARFIANQLGLSRVALMPCYLSPHKSTTVVSPEHRLGMVRAACENEPLFYPDDRELSQHCPSYTVHTLEKLRQELPDHALCFFIGSDSLSNFTRWHQWQKILQLCHLVVCSRKTRQKNQTLYADELKQRIVYNPDNLAKQRAGCILLATTPVVDVSSTEIRQAIAHNRPWQHLVPAAVAEYIEQHNLYR